VGYSYGCASILVLLLIEVYRSMHAGRILPSARAFLVAFIVFSGALFSLYLTLCFSRGIDPLARSREFLGIVQSTNNWALYVIGDPRTLPYALLYSILPAVCTACLFILLIRPGKSVDTTVAVSVLFSYFLNFVRAMGRHCLAVENQIDFVIWTGVLGIAFFAATYLPAIKRAAFVFFGVILATSVFNANALLDAKPIIQTAISSAGSPDYYYKGSSERTQRVDLTPPLVEYQSVLNMIAKVIPEGDTYVDLTGETMLYALSGRKKPVYINQSPLHLSGEYTQERFISQIDAYVDYCNFTLLSESRHLDTLKNNYRYYKVYEYLYEHFRPLALSSDGFALWVRKNEYERYIPVIENISQEISPIGYDYLDSVHNFILGQIPYVWGQYDNKKAWENKLMIDFDVSDSPWQLSLQSISYSNYILLEIDSNSSREASLHLLNDIGDTISSFDFSINPGKARYLIRTSTDWYWNSGVARSFSIEADSDVTLLAVRILSGD
jgi:hypothetical protein